MASGYLLVRLLGEIPLQIWLCNSDLPDDFDDSSERLLTSCLTEWLAHDFNPVGIVPCFHDNSTLQATKLM
jgi:hypothetical protein